MIKTMTVTNRLGEAITLELRRPEKSGFLVRGIDGLTPCKATINTNDIVTDDGAVFNSSRVGSRNIVLALDFMENPTIEDTRQNSYKYFPIKELVSIRIETDKRIVGTYGYIESNEPNIFSAEEGTGISIICPDAYLYSPDNEVTNFSDIMPLFEFPFSCEEAYTDNGDGYFMGVLSIPTSIPPLNVPEKFLEFGEIETRTEGTIVYSGEASVGIIIDIHATGPVTGLAISNINTQETMIFDSAKLTTLTGSGIIALDDIIISTIKGNKYVILQRAGVQTNIFNCINRDADWFQLSKGINMFGYTATTGIENLQFKIENQIAYEGV